MFRGFATVNVFADDVVAARDWYAQVFDAEAYDAMPPAPAAPAYVEFRVGDDADEFGIIDRRFAPPGSRDATGSAGAIVHWHVDDLPGTIARLLALGATEYQPLTEHGDGDSPPRPWSTRSATSSGSCTTRTSWTSPRPARPRSRPDEITRTAAGDGTMGAAPFARSDTPGDTPSIAPPSG